MKQITDYLKAHEQRFIDELVEYLRFPSVSAQSVHKKDMTACARWLANHGKSIGLKARVHKTDGHPIVTLATPRKRTGSRPHFLVYGHYDVQPPDPLELWDTPPFDPQIRGRNLYARGASDNKGQHFAHIKAVEAYLKTGTELPCDLTFVVEGEEEVGGEAAIRDGFGPDVCGELQQHLSFRHKLGRSGGRAAMKVLLEVDEALRLALQASGEVTLHPPVDCFQALVAEGVVNRVRGRRALPDAQMRYAQLRHALLRRPPRGEVEGRRVVGLQCLQLRREGYPAALVVGRARALHQVHLLPIRRDGCFMVPPLRSRARLPFFEA